MKKVFKLSLFLLLCLTVLSNCKKDNDNDNGQTPFGKLDGNKITNLIKNEGVIKIAGMPPAPTGTGAPILDAVSEDVIGALEFGVSTSFKINGEFEGAYVLIEGASSYLKIPFDGLIGGKFGKKAKNKFSSPNKMQDEEEEELDFFLSLPDLTTPGTFCYEICLYDSANNVSNIERICVTIDAWGGNSSLVGKWRYELDESYLNGVLLSRDTLWNSIGNEACENNDIIYEFFFKEQDFIEFKSNGDYIESSDKILVTEIPDVCKDFQTIFSNGNYNETTFGKWAFNTSSNRLTNIGFSFCYSCQEPGEVIELFEKGILFRKSNIIINNNTLIFEDIDTNNNGDVYIEKTILKKI